MLTPNAKEKKRHIGLSSLRLISLYASGCLTYQFPITFQNIFGGFFPTWQDDWIGAIGTRFILTSSSEKSGSSFRRSMKDKLVLGRAHVGGTS